MNSVIILSVLLVLFSFWSVSDSDDKCQKATEQMACVEKLWKGIEKTAQKDCCASYDVQCTQIIATKANCPEVYSKKEIEFKNLMESVKTHSCDNSKISSSESVCKPLLSQTNPEDCGKHSFCTNPFNGCSLLSTSMTLALSLSLITSFVLFCIR